MQEKILEIKQAILNEGKQAQYKKNLTEKQVILHTLKDEIKTLKRNGLTIKAITTILNKVLMEKDAREKNFFSVQIISDFMYEQGIVKKIKKNIKNEPEKPVDMPKEEIVAKTIQEEEKTPQNANEGILQQLQDDGYDMEGVSEAEAKKFLDEDMVQEYEQRRQARTEW